jgi:hypothetical protein
MPNITARKSCSPKSLSKSCPLATEAVNTLLPLRRGSTGPALFRRERCSETAATELRRPASVLS